MSQSPVGEVLVGEGLEGIYDCLDLARYQRVDRGSGSTIVQRFPALLAVSPAPLGQSRTSQVLDAGQPWPAAWSTRSSNPRLTAASPRAGIGLSGIRPSPLFSPAPPAQPPVRSPCA